MIVLVIISLASLGATEMGLDYSSLTMSIDEETLYMTGRYFLGPGHSFINFPKEQREVRFPGDGYNILTGRTRDGLRVDLSVAFQLRLRPVLAQIVKLYYEWGIGADGSGGYMDAYAMIARNTLRDVSSEYEAYDFFYNKTEIEAVMQSRLKQSIEPHAADLETLQLLEVDLPPSFYTVLQETETTRLGIKHTENKVIVAEVDAQNRVNRVQEEAAVITLEKETEAKVLSNTLERERATFIADIQAEINSYKTLQDEVGLHGRNMMNYIWLQSVGASKSAKAKIVVPKPDDIDCFADPRKCVVGPSQYGQPATSLTYACAQGEACVLAVPGRSLSDHDEVRLVNRVNEKTDCQGSMVALLDPGLAFQTKATTSSTDERKGFQVGTPAGPGAYSVCYCTWTTQLVGCAGASAFAPAGLLTVP